MSTLTQTLIEEIKAAPEPVRQGLFAFVTFPKARRAARDEDRKALLTQAHGRLAFVQNQD